MTDAAASDKRAGADASGGKTGRGDGDAKSKRKGPPRSPRHVKAAARVLQKEARKILRKHGQRIALDPAEEIRACVAAIDTHRANDNWGALEDEAEKLDELLHQHASFARKSALRETLENIGIAVLIALGLRSCFYEPFKIPSGSMMPTLRAGDHIFVNKFTYGIQIPFTTTVVGEDLGEIERGDVIVFRYPLDKSEDFIKRVIGLPGDEIRVDGRKVAIKRKGDDTFEVLQRKPLKQRCTEGDKVVANCQLFEESLDGRIHVVRYMVSLDDRGEFRPKPRSWTVPERHLLVMGDNRNQSHDSLAWTVTVEAVSADKLLTVKDLRDLTAERLFDPGRPGDGTELSDPKHDHVVYLAKHRSPVHDVKLAVWREPTFGAEAVFAATTKGATATTMTELLDGAGGPRGPDRDRALEVGAGIDALATRRQEHGWDATVLLAPAKSVIELHCGDAVCRGPGALATTVADVVARFSRDHEQDARDLMTADDGIEYQTHWTGRGDPRDHYTRRHFSGGSKLGTGARSEARLEAFRHPNEGIEVLRDAALAAAGSSPDQAKGLASLGEDAWLVDRGDAFTYVGADHVRDMLVVLDCGKDLCPNQTKATELASEVQSRVPKASADRRRLGDLLGQADVGNWAEVPVPRLDKTPFDRVQFEGSVTGEQYAVEVEVWLKPPEGLGARVAKLRASGDWEDDDALQAGGIRRETDDAYEYAFGVEASSTVVRLSCRKGLCPDVESALALARRASAKARDPRAFIDPEAERPKPFVPRGHVKGRAERIWLPFERFWLPIR